MGYSLEICGLSYSNLRIRDVLHILFCVADLQMVNISLRVLSRPNASVLPHIYRTLGLDYDDRVLPSICNEVNVACTNSKNYIICALLIFRAASLLFVSKDGVAEGTIYVQNPARITELLCGSTLNTEYHDWNYLL